MLGYFLLFFSLATILRNGVFKSGKILEKDIFAFLALSNVLKCKLVFLLLYQFCKTKREEKLLEHYKTFYTTLFLSESLFFSSYIYL